MFGPRQYKTAPLQQPARHLLTQFHSKRAAQEVERELAPYAKSMHSIVVYPRDAATSEPDIVLEPELRDLQQGARRDGQRPRRDFAAGERFGPVLDRFAPSALTALRCGCRNGWGTARRRQGLCRCCLWARVTARTRPTSSGSRSWPVAVPMTSLRRNAKASPSLTTPPSGGWHLQRRDLEN
jgi:hypothetical protein